MGRACSAARARGDLLAEPGGGKWWIQALLKQKRPQNSSLATGRGSHIPAWARIRDRNILGVEGGAAWTASGDS